MMVAEDIIFLLARPGVRLIAKHHSVRVEEAVFH
jgi:hypothetical protein